MGAVKKDKEGKKARFMSDKNKASKALSQFLCSSSFAYVGTVGI